MTERLGDVEARIGTVRQLSSVIGAMRGIAAVRSHEAAARLPGIHSYAATIGGAIARALMLAAPAATAAVPLAATAAVPPAATAAVPPAGLVIALCAEQGFVGPFTAHVLAAVPGCSALVVVGTRGLAPAHERGLPVVATLPMVSHVDQIVALTNRLADLVLARIAAEGLARVTVVHAIPAANGQPTAIVTTQLLPFDLARFADARHAPPPIVQVPAARLVAQLADEYMFAQLCEALTLSFAAENEARMHAMVAARDNVAHKLDDLEASARRLRQEAITAEVIELAASRDA